MCFYMRVAKAAFSSALLLSLLSFLGACHHDGFGHQAGHSPKFKQDVSYCKWLARSVASQYDSSKDALWFYEFGKEKNGKEQQQITDYVNHHKPNETQFVTFTALSIYDVTYQHMGIGAVISLCLARKNRKSNKADIKMASALQ